MNNFVLWKVASPMIGLGLVLTTLGVFAAWNIQHQQSETSAAIVREVQSLTSISQSFLEARELRYRLAQFMIMRQTTLLEEISSKLIPAVDKRFETAKERATSQREQDLLSTADTSYHAFVDAFARLDRQKLDDNELRQLLDMTDRIMDPLNTCIAEAEQVVYRTNESAQNSSRQLANGLLLLGVTGGAAGILLGLAVARGIGRSIVQLNVSVQSVASRLATNPNRISFTRVGDIGGIETNLRSLEQDIERVVETLQQREYELLRSEQLARVGQMAAGLAHELRNPLMPMKMLVQAALQSGNAAPLSPKSLQILNDEILRLEETIQSFLDFARPRMPVYQLTDIGQFLTTASSFVADKADQLSIAIDLHLPTSPVQADVDQNLLRQLFLNVVNNAMDAMGNGGSLTITLEQTRRIADEPDQAMAPSLAMVNQKENPDQSLCNWIVITFADTGPGIDPAIADTLFEPFVTTKETGTGIGLSICQQIATAHGGSLHATNRNNCHGAEFKLMLPQHTK